MKRLKRSRPTSVRECIEDIVEFVESFLEVRDVSEFPSISTLNKAKTFDAITRSEAYNLLKQFIQEDKYSCDKRTNM